MAEQSKVGSHVGSVVDSVAVDTQRQLLLARWAQVGLVALPKEDFAMVAASEVDSMALEEDEVGSAVVEVSRIVEDTAEVAEEVLASEVDLEEGIVVGTRTAHLPPMLQLVQVAEVEDLEADSVEDQDLVLLQIATALRLVGMVREMAAAHLMTEMVVIVEALVHTPIVMRRPEVEVVATWSQ